MSGDRFLPRLLPLLLGVLLIGSCAGPQYVEAAVEGYARDATALEAKRTFRFAGGLDEIQPLRDKALFQEFAIVLEAQGLQQVHTEEADLHIHLDAVSEETTIVVPARYEMGRRFSVGQWRTAYHRGSDGKLHPEPVYYPGTWESTPYRVPASSIPAYAHRLDVRIHDVEDRLLWQGTIDVIDRSRDLFRLLRLFLPELAQEFPRPSGKGVERRALRDADQSDDFESSS